MLLKKGAYMSILKKYVVCQLRKLLDFFFKSQHIFPVVQVNVNTEWVGSSYGGFFMCTDFQITNASIVYSFGVGEDISFDQSIIEKYFCSVYAFDPTPKSINWIKNNKLLPNKIFFFDYGIASHDGTVMFYPPENPEHVSCSVIKKQATESLAFKVPVKRLSTILSEFNHKQIDILKMDIEGAEYDVIKDILASKIIIKQLLVEFHHRFSGLGVVKTKKIIKKLNKAGFKIAAISSNGEEYCFVNVRELKR
jgi:FkbM family methyltransferase